MDRQDIDDSVAAGAFWRLIDHLRHRSDVQNVDLMGIGGFCRNCLSDWLQESASGEGIEITAPEARQVIYGMPYEQWKSEHQQPASPEQLALMQESVARNRR